MTEYQQNQPPQSPDVKKTVFDILPPPSPDLQRGIMEVCADFKMSPFEFALYYSQRDKAGCIKPEYIAAALSLVTDLTEEAKATILARVYENLVEYLNEFVKANDISHEQEPTNTRKLRGPTSKNPFESITEEITSAKAIKKRTIREIQKAQKIAQQLREIAYQPPKSEANSSSPPPSPTPTSS